jgi:stage II sporulation protein D
VSVDVDKFSREINHNISSISSKYIRKWNKNKQKYINASVSNLGKLKSICVIERKKGNLVTKIEIKGTKARVEISNQYNIRKLLTIPNEKIMLNDGSEINNMNMLPSCFFTISKKQNNYVISGGGYGHGVGMSQWGAHELAKRGLNYQEILGFYYKDIDIK